jgi:hypothetical protein
LLGPPNYATSRYERRSNSVGGLGVRCPSVSRHSRQGCGLCVVSATSCASEAKATQPERRRCGRRWIRAWGASRHGLAQPRSLLGWSFGKAGACPALAVRRNGASVDVGPGLKGVRRCQALKPTQAVRTNCGAISGGLALLGHELYHEGCRVWNGAVRRRPAVVPLCKQPEDVQAAVRAPRGARLVIDLTGMRNVADGPASAHGHCRVRRSGERRGPLPPASRIWSRHWATAAWLAWPA